MSKNGFITIQRKITEWRWWGNQAAMSLWLYILVNANWKDGWWNHGQEVVKRGEFITSQGKIANELEMNRKTVARYLKLFVEEGQIEVITDNTKTLIKVINYAKYQDVPDDDGQLDGQVNGQVSGQHTGQRDGQLDGQLTGHNRTNINQNKPSEPLNNNRGNFKPPTLEEVRAYCRERKNSIDPETFVDFYASKGWLVGKSKMKDWKACVRTWEKNQRSTAGNNGEEWKVKKTGKPEDYSEPSAEYEKSIEEFFGE